MHFNIIAALITSFNELFTNAVTVVLRGILSYTSRVKNHLDLVLYKLNPSLMPVAAQQEQQDWASNEIEESSLG
jgi:phage-related protein